MAGSRRAPWPLLLAAAAACGDAGAPRERPATATLVVALLGSGTRDVYSMRLDGSALTRLTFDPADDGRPVASASAAFFVSVRDGHSAIYTVPLSGGAERRVTGAAETANDPAVSPDGRRLAYTSSASGPPRLVVAGVDGAGAAVGRAAARDAAALDASPAWRPDGGAIAWTTSAAGSADVVAASLEAAAPTLLAGGPAAEVEPAWSPDGSMLAFVSTRDGDQALFVATLATGAVRRLSPSRVSVSSPTWVSASDVVYVARDDGGATTLRRQPSDGRSASTVIPLPAWMVPSHPSAVPSGP